MTLDGRRTRIRAFFPRFVREADRDIRNFTPEVAADWKLRSGWMKRRLGQMGELLRERQWTMPEYVAHLRDLERDATPADPMPALDAIVADHRATGWKTLSVFVRDCVGGHSFAIDSRVSPTRRVARRAKTSKPCETVSYSGPRSRASPRARRAPTRAPGPATSSCTRSST